VPKKNVNPKTPKRKPELRDSIPKRTIQRNVIAEVKEGGIRRIRDRPQLGRSFTCSFTLTPELDQALHEEAVKQNRPRSAIVRSAILMYIGLNGEGADRG